MSTVAPGIGGPGRPMFGSRADVLADLQRRISTGDLSVGDKLPAERELCADYRVSRPVIREILRGLEERGYIDIYASRGSFVREMSGKDLIEPVTRLAVRAGVTPRHMVQARIALEMAAASYAAAHRTEQQLEELMLALRKHAKGGTILEQARTDVAFHESIMAAAANPVIEMMFASIRNLVFGLMVRSHTDSLVQSAGDPMHAVIYECIQRRDSVGAAEAMRQHLSLALELYGNDLDENLDDILIARGFSVQTMSDLALEG